MGAKHRGGSRNQGRGGHRNSRNQGERSVCRCPECGHEHVRRGSGSSQARKQAFRALFNVG